MYERARNAIEGYEDKEGNWVRPEGIRADKVRDSSLPKSLQWIENIGKKPVNKELARSTYLEADQVFKKAMTLQGEEQRDAYRAEAVQRSR